MKKVYLFALVFATISLLFAQNLKYKVNEKSCISCTLCVSKCPVKAIEMKNNKAVIDPAKCIGCGLCVPACPVKAIDKDQPAKPASPDSTKQAIPDSSSKKLKTTPVTPSDKSQGKTDVSSPKETVAVVESPAVGAPVVADVVKTVFNVDAKSCIGCKICIAKCPVNAITYKQRTAIIDPVKCIGCGLCAPVCPVKSITKSEIVIKGN